MKKIYTFSLAALLGIVLMSGVIDLNHLFNYSNQDTPYYLSKDNTPRNNTLTDAGATLGRVLFYDKNLSVNNTTACASCHLQEFAFGDTAIVSVGAYGVTRRHSMRLVNARFSTEDKAFWDKRASSLEDQATKPIQDPVEMGFSGINGAPGFDDLIEKMNGIDYYPLLFKFVFGDSLITEERVQKALAQFVRSIQSFDSKFDEGRAQVSNSEVPFPNFTAQENMGKDLFFTHPPRGGAGCARCHSGTEFTIIPSSQNNGVIAEANDTSAIDLTNTNPPSLRDLVNKDGRPNGPFMHNGSLKTLMDVVNHYDHLEEVPENTNLDFRLSGNIHNLNLTDVQKDALVAFLETLSGEEIYTAERWSNPFDEQGNITIVPLDPDGTSNPGVISSFEVFPNPASDIIHLQMKDGMYQLRILDMDGRMMRAKVIGANHTEDISTFPNGSYTVHLTNLNSNGTASKKFVKN